MLPILFTIPKLSSLTLLLTVSITLVILSTLFFLFRKRINSVKKFKNDITAYFLIITCILILLHLFGPFPVKTYGMAVALGFLSAIIISRHLCRKNEINPDIIMDLALYVIIGVFIGAKLFFIIFYDWQNFIEHPASFFSPGGFVFYGGLIGGILSGLYYVLKKKLPLLKIADIMGIVLYSGLFFGRLGCFFYGCCFGKIAPAFPLAIRYPAVCPQIPGYTLAFEKHLHQGLVLGSDTHSLPIYPTQLISSLNGLLMFFVLLFLYKKRKFNGQIAGLSLMIYAVTRSLIEFLRTEPTFLYLSISQWISIFIFMAGLTLYKWARSKSSLQTQ